MKYVAFLSKPRLDDFKGHSSYKSFATKAILHIPHCYHAYRKNDPKLWRKKRIISFDVYREGYVSKLRGVLNFAAVFFAS